MGISHLFERRGLGKADETSGSQRYNHATPRNCFNMELLVSKLRSINLLLPEPRLDLRSVAELGQLSASSISCSADQSLSSRDVCFLNSFAITLFFCRCFNSTVVLCHNSWPLQRVPTLPTLKHSREAEARCNDKRLRHS